MREAHLQGLPSFGLHAFDLHCIPGYTFCINVREGVFFVYGP
jgi:hypothetical protein